MQDRLLGYMNKVSEKWNGLEKGQKIRLGVTVLLILAILGTTIYFLTRPNMKVLVNKLTYSQASEIQKTLDEAGIKYKLAKGGEAILVREADNDKAQIVLSDNEITKQPGFTWPDALKASGMGTTETIKKENIRLAAETALANKLVLFEGVKAANVTLALPDDTNFFIESKNQPSVNAVLTVEDGKTITKTQATTIARQLSASVVGLTLDNIEISNQNMELLYSGAEQEAQLQGEMFEKAYELERQYKKDIESKVNFYLKPIFPEVRVLSHIALKTDKSLTRSKTLEPPVAGNDIGVITREETRKQTATDVTPQAEPGLGANNGEAPTYNTGENTTSSASTSESIIDYDYNVIERETDEGTGSVIPEDSSLSISVYRTRNYDEAYMTTNNLLNGMTWQAFKEANRNPVLIAVEQQLIDNIRIGTKIDNISVVGFEIPMFADKPQEPLNIGQYILFGIAAVLILILAYGLIKKTQADEVGLITEEELDVEQVIAQTQLDEETEQEMRLRDIDFEKDSEAKLQIEKFIQERPESVAHLLRNWLNDDWE